MNMRKIIYVVTTLTGLSALTMCSTKKEANETKSSAKEVKTSVVRQLQPEKAIVLPGDLRPWEIVNMHSKVKGYVKVVKADRGSLG